ncbi:hypothetical protein AA309_17830 [Microvirga vignae]|uniref:Transposase Tn5-like N-terminal domain-containing protein n=1 Tax=Microvirga vignae TaxID=1225564 RepID=A0A0H1R9Y1_9HYPH|nr:transposase DNA-binding-containing protein [Microvirga vignae]KLK91849.1 hypothetical protein AA309_17830 [Microvirga vignae]
MDPMLEGASWLDEELAGSTFADARLGQRLRRLSEQLGGIMGASLLQACQDWAATKAAYRFFDNDQGSEAEILAGHFAATASRVTATERPILILHDTTEFTYHRVRPEPVGVTRQSRPEVSAAEGGVFEGRDIDRTVILLCIRWIASSLGPSLLGQ